MTYRGRPDTCDGHVFSSLPDEIHGETFGQNAHADFAHGICRLSFEETRINWWADDNDAALPREFFKMR